ncbi:unnamed protein product [Hermetia illucens]|uniref:Roundabout n=1 Tax=Hermetia illucens TaxID=343691 RepID=A0A7R8YXV2_HERIL|nr:unnamed protein product [Hermetia illucens]
MRCTHISTDYEQCKLRVVMKVLREDFRLEPQNTRVAQGDTALLECAPPKGIPEPVVSWRKNGQKLELEGSKRLRIVDGGNLAIQDARQTDEGQYQCIAKNLVGIRESSAAILKIHVKPFLIRGPHNQIVVEGSSVTFQCRVGGDPMPDVLWRRTASGGNMPLDRVHILEDRSLRLEGVTLNDEGEYSCEADNVVGSISAMGTLTVYSAPKFIIHPTPQSREPPSDVSFECKASGNPKPTMFWSIEGNRSLIFPGTKLDRFETTSTDEGLTILTLPQIKRTDDGLVVICSAINPVGSISARARLTVTSQEDRPPPIIIYGPANQTLPVKSIAVLNCKATGTPKPIISWYRDGIPVVAQPGKSNITESGTLIISDLDRNEDQGLYTCVASSRSGKSTWSGFLRLEIPTNPNIKFYRAPDISKFPSAPGKPQVVNVTEDAIAIMWEPSSKPGGSEIIGYSVEVFSNNMTKGWVPTGTKIMENVYIETGLTFGASYMFIVRAENLHGLSPPSPMSDVIVAGKSVVEEDVSLNEAQAILSSGDVVELLEANATDSTSVRLAWEIVNGQYVEGFYIYSREMTTNGSYKMLTVLHGGGASACTITGLMKATEYEFFLVPFYKVVEGKPSNSRRAKTFEDVPSGAPSNMEAVLFNTTAVYLKWQPPSNSSLNGVLTSYHVIVRGLDALNISRILTNMTVEATTPSLLLANLTSGVTYYISVAAATRKGVGPFSQPATLRLDPKTKKLDQGYTRYPISRNISDDFLTQTWFIVLLGSIIAVIVFLFGAMVLFKRYQFIKQTSLGSIHGNHAIGTVRKFPTLPLNAAGVWIDPTGGVWRQASTVTKDSVPDYAQISTAPTLPLPDYERLTPLNMPDYAEVAGCSTFKNHPISPLYDSCGAYATTNLVTNAKLYQNRYATGTLKDTTGSLGGSGAKHHRGNGLYSAPSSNHYNLDASNFMFSDTNYPINKTPSPSMAGVGLGSGVSKGVNSNTTTSTGGTGGGAVMGKMNIIENKMDLINNLNRTSSSSSSTTSVPNHISSAMSSRPLLNGFSSSSNVAGGGHIGGIGGGHIGYGNMFSGTGAPNGLSSSTTIKRNRHPKLFSSDNKINFGNGSSISHSNYGSVANAGVGGCGGKTPSGCGGMTESFETHSSSGNNNHYGEESSLAASHRSATTANGGRNKDSSLTWSSSVQNASYQYPNSSVSSSSHGNNSNNVMPASATSSSNKSDSNHRNGSGSQIYLSSFGKSDNV